MIPAHVISGLSRSGQFFMRLCTRWWMVRKSMNNRCLTYMGCCSRSVRMGSSVEFGWWLYLGFQHDEATLMWVARVHHS